MKKRRSTVYVRPGKDVTLYIPSETPAEVIDYLNRLKAEGVFSQGVMDIITAYVQGRRDAAAFPPPAQSREEIGDTGTYSEPLAAEEYEMPAAERSADAVPAAPSKKLNLAQIFSLSQKNSGKLLGGHDNE